MLTDGLAGFRERVLKPVSLRDEPLSDEQAGRVRAWRQFFLASEAGAAAPQGSGAAPHAAASGSEDAKALPKMIDTAWLAANLQRPDMKIIDVRKQPEYNTGHVPGALALNPESLRGNVGGVPSVLLPGELIAAQLGLMGIRPDDTVVIVGGEKLRDATLVGMGLDRVGHARWAILDGGFPQWTTENRPTTAAIPKVARADYPTPNAIDAFTVDAQAVAAKATGGNTAILDVRPAEYFTGAKSDEARAGHIPGAVNRPYSEDLGESGYLKPASELAAAYGKALPPKDTPVVVHCRTGHQASQSYFVLRHVLGYPNVLWYDGSWTDWAARPDLPVEKE